MITHHGPTIAGSVDVKGLPPDFTEDELRALFANFGDITEAKFVPSNTGGDGSGQQSTPTTATGSSSDRVGVVVFRKDHNVPRALAEMFQYNLGRGYIIHVNRSRNPSRPHNASTTSWPGHTELLDDESEEDEEDEVEDGEYVGGEPPSYSFVPVSSIPNPAGPSIPTPSFSRLPPNGKGQQQQPGYRPIPPPYSGIMATCAANEKRHASSSHAPDKGLASNAQPQPPVYQAHSTMPKLFPQRKENNAGEDRDNKGKCFAVGTTGPIILSAPSSTHPVVSSQPTTSSAADNSAVGRFFPSPLPVILSRHDLRGLPAGQLVLVPNSGFTHIA